MPSPIVIETSAIEAIASSTNDHHTAAARSFRELVDGEADLLITSDILSEAMDFLCSRWGVLVADRFFKSVLPLLKVVSASESDRVNAWSLFEDKRRGAFTFVDCLTLALAKRSGARIFAFYPDFEAEGLFMIPSPTAPNT
jgi:predicted nucleic acid-binding protein